METYRSFVDRMASMAGRSDDQAAAGPGARGAARPDPRSPV